MKQHFGWIPPEKRDYGVQKEHARVMQDMPLMTAEGRNIAGTGEGKVVLLHKALEQVAGTYPVLRQAIGDCYTGDTLVVGPQVKPIKDIVVGDEVWTAEGNLTRVVSTRAIQTARLLVKVTPLGGLPVTCTADHRLLVYRMARVGGKRVTSAYYERAKAPVNGSTRGYSAARVIECYESRAPEWVAAGDLCDTDYLLTPLGVEHSYEQPAIPCSLFTLGFFLGNGHAAKASSRSGSAEWVGNSSDESLAARIHLDLDSAGLSPKRSGYAGRNAWRIRVHSRTLCEWLRSQFYDGNGAKVFPQWAIGDAEFLDGLRAADGHGNGWVENIDSTSPSIAFGVTASLLEMGHDATIAEVVRSRGTYDNAKPLYRVTWRPQGKQRGTIWRDGQFMCRPVRSVEFIEGPSTVYDIGVADSHHSFLANGYATHNCVSFGFAKGVDLRSAVEILIEGQPERWPGALQATEWIYGTSRVLVGRGRLGNSDGSMGSWAARAVQDHGTLIRQQYDSVDLRRYSGARAKDWGYRGLPSSTLEPTADEHPIQKTALVTSYEQARDAIANGYPVPVCSNQGFSSTRDAQGFARPSGSWAHCMVFVAVDDEALRPGLLCDNSWGAWNSGPKRHEQPDGSFWVDAEVADRMLRGEDSFALADYRGFVEKNLWSLW